jgi:RHH-type proline utilization regulon transcriptional repressor/proline dehydrogenase/delta 1-pyrroline-5-carboxylate dehydrogenase
VQAKARNVGFTIDAEEADRLELSLDLIERWPPTELAGWDGLGLAVQAYQKRALPPSTGSPTSRTAPTGG